MATLTLLLTESNINILHFRRPEHVLNVQQICWTSTKFSDFQYLLWTFKENWTPKQFFWRSKSEPEKNAVLILQPVGSGDGIGPVTARNDDTSF